MSSEQVNKPVSRSCIQRCVTESDRLPLPLPLPLPKLKRSVCKTYYTIEEQLEKEDEDEDEIKAGLDLIGYEYPEHVYDVEHNGKHYLRSATNTNVYNYAYCRSSVVVGRWNELENKVELVEDLVNKIAELEAKIAIAIAIAIAEKDF
jgi:hypothetical protein